jgi:MoxR-like ATPase
MSQYNNLIKTKNLFKTVFLHDEYYINAIMASFASKSHICLLGARGSGKTHAMECLAKMIAKEIVAYQQGYLSAEIEDVFARPDISSLMKGEEKVIWKKMTLSRVKCFDEIQRLGLGALSTMFRLMTNGTVQYLDKEEGHKEFWVIATANPTEQFEDNLNINLPEPLWDRFYGVLWVPIAPLKYQIKINGKVEEAKEALPTIWNESNLLELWKEANNVEIDPKIEYVVTLMNRIMGYCKYAQNYDASSLNEQQKREMCSKCNNAYICSEIERPPSVRAKIALLKLAKGFAYLRGSNKVDLIDIENAFPLVYWKRIKLMDEDQISDRLSKLRELCRKLIAEIKEAKEAIDIIEELRNAFDQNKYERLQNYVNSKSWLEEAKEDLDYYFEMVYQQLKEKYENADIKTKYKIYTLAKLKLPLEKAREFEINEEVEIELTPENLAKIAKISSEEFQRAKYAFDNGEKTIKLKGEMALKWIIREGK